jgi:hypothetical protein
LRDKNDESPYMVKTKANAQASNKEKQKKKHTQS